MLFSEENQQDYQDVFGTFDKEGSGIPVGDLKNALRALGYYPTQEELKKLEDGYAGKPHLNFDEFIEVLKKVDKKSTPDADLLHSAFYEFDVEGLGMMTPKQLRYILTSMAEPWTNEEVDELIQHLGIGNEPFDYRSIIDLMSAATPFKTK